MPVSVSPYVNIYTANIYDVVSKMLKTITNTILLLKIQKFDSNIPIIKNERYQSRKCFK